jgi:hypothetical protein
MPLRHTGRARRSERVPLKYVEHTRVLKRWATGHQGAVLKPKIDRLSVTPDWHDEGVKATIRNHLRNRRRVRVPRSHRLRRATLR